MSGPPKRWPHARTEENPMARTAQESISGNLEFAQCLRALRARLVGKQVALSMAVRCTEAAISFWEAGRRLPVQLSLARIQEALIKSGATPFELEELRNAWQRAQRRKSDPELLIPSIVRDQ